MLCLLCCLLQVALGISMYIQQHTIYTCHIEMKHVPHNTSGRTASYATYTVHSNEMMRSPKIRFIACLALCSYSGLPVRRDRVPNSRSKVPAHAVQVKRVSLGNTPCTATTPCTCNVTLTVTLTVAHCWSRTQQRHEAANTALILNQPDG